MAEPTLTATIYALLEDLQKRTGKTMREIEAEVRLLERWVNGEESPVVN